MKDLVLHFDFGYSYQNNIPVKEQIFDRVPGNRSRSRSERPSSGSSAGIAIGTISAVKRRPRSTA